jgi:SAM-dependent methyltransferase
MSKFRGSVSGSIQSAEWVLPQLTAPAGDWLEVGIGPLGVGCSHFMGCQGQLHTLDPLEPTPADEWKLPEPCLALVRSCQEASQRHVGQAEKLEFAEDSMSFVAMENMLDHVQDPAAVLAEARRVLMPGGQLYIAVDTFSTVGEARFNLISKRKWRGTTFVRAHPHRFSAAGVLALAANAGFRVTKSELPSSIEAQLGRHFRIRLLAQ